METVEPIVFGRNRRYLLAYYLVLSLISLIPAFAGFIITICFVDSLAQHLFTFETAMLGFGSIVWDALLALLFYLVARSILAVFKNKPAIVISKDGVNVRGPAYYPCGLIKWDEMKYITPYQYPRPSIFGGGKCVLIYLTDTFPIRRYPLRLRGLAKLREVTWRGKYVFIPERVLLTTAEDVIARLNQFYLTNVVNGRPEREPEAP